MSGNVALVIEMTFVVIILAWILTHSADFGKVAGQIGTQYTAGVGALMPTVGRQQ